MFRLHRAFMRVLRGLGFSSMLFNPLGLGHPNSLLLEGLWVLVKGLNLSYHNKETILFTIDPYCGNLNKPLNR